MYLVSQRGWVMWRVSAPSKSAALKPFRYSITLLARAQLVQRLPVVGVLGDFFAGQALLSAARREST